MKNIRDTFGEPDADGVVRDPIGRTGFRAKGGYVFLFADEANERYARLLAESEFFRRPQFVRPIIEDGKLVLESSGRRAVVKPETWEGLKDALIRIHFEYAPKVHRSSPSSV